VVPPQAITPLVAKKRGRPAKTTRLSAETEPSVRRSSMLNPQLEMVLGVQIDMTLEFESVLAVVPTNNLVAEWVELQSRSLVDSRTLWEELERTIAVGTKQKNELVESSSSLKATLEAM